MNNGVIDDNVGYLITDCPPPFNATMKQRFVVTIGSKSYSLTTVNSITWIRDDMGKKTVEVQMTTP